MTIGENFTAEEIARWTKAGHWPPQEGLTVLPRITPSKDAVLSLFGQLLHMVTPKQGEAVKKAMKSL